MIAGRWSAEPSGALPPKELFIGAAEALVATDRAWVPDGAGESLYLRPFMIATDPYLQRFVQEFTETNNGKAYFASLDRLGAFIFRDFESGKRKTVY